MSAPARFVGVDSGLQVAGPPVFAEDDGAMLALRASALPAMLAIPLLAPWLARITPERRITFSLGAAALLSVLCAFLTGAVAIGVCLFVFVAGFGFPAVSLSAAVILGAGALLALGSVARFQAGRRL